MVNRRNSLLTWALFGNTEGEARFLFFVLDNHVPVTGFQEAFGPIESDGIHKSKGNEITPERRH
jgi:hypothetical protein